MEQTTRTKTATGLSIYLRKETDKEGREDVGRLCCMYLSVDCSVAVGWGGLGWCLHPTLRRLLDAMSSMVSSRCARHEGSAGADPRRQVNPQTAAGG